MPVLKSMLMSALMSVLYFAIVVVMVYYKTEETFQHINYFSMVLCASFLQMCSLMLLLNGDFSWQLNK
jgi:hypothetical protein